MKTCRICGKPVNAPYRVYDAHGKVLQGCVAADHDGQLVIPSESARWHNRATAKALRRITAVRYQYHLKE